MLWALILLAACAAIVDLRYREIPDWISISILIIALTGLFLTKVPDVRGQLTGFVLAVALGWLLFAVGAWGGGDVKLFGSFGAVLGLPLVLTAMFWTAIAGGALALIAMSRRHRDFAYGPAIAFGCCSTLIRHSEQLFVTSIDAEVLNICGFHLNKL